MNGVVARHIYGPVPSRRLGSSLGVDLVPFKTCTYDCIYCQLGRTTNLTVQRAEYVKVDSLVRALKRKLADGPRPDYVTLSGSGEPTLNAGLGSLIRRIKRLTSVPVAVLTNGSLLGLLEVRQALQGADLVVPSLDAGDDELFQYVNRPVREISFARMVDGLIEFTQGFRGAVWLEVLLLGGVTGIPFAAKKLAALVAKVNPARVQLNTVTRPPAEDFAFAVEPAELKRLARLIPGRVEVITGRRTVRRPVVRASRTMDREVLNLLRRRPCTPGDVAAGLSLHLLEVVKSLERLTGARKVRVVETRGRRFYLPTGAQHPGAGQ